MYHNGCLTLFVTQSQLFWWLEKKNSVHFFVLSPIVLLGHPPSKALHLRRAFFHHRVFLLRWGHPLAEPQWKPVAFVEDNYAFQSIQSDLKVMSNKQQVREQEAWREWEGGFSLTHQQLLSCNLATPDKLWPVLISFLVTSRLTWLLIPKPVWGVEKEGRYLSDTSDTSMIGTDMTRITMINARATLNPNKFANNSYLPQWFWWEQYCQRWPWQQVQTSSL